ncbi:MAG: hypothetical protein C0392_01785 [Syntrophus sp. (in: bacteria)]|nr:hypothetical protein [Syntrophus sp. (in: bacteria)]
MDIERSQQVLSRINPNKYSTRLMLMILMSGLIPVIIFAVLNGFLLIGLGVLIVCLAVCWVGVSFSKTILRLREATEQINQGNFNVSVEPSLSGDVGGLAEDFNRMVDQLRSTTVSKRLLEESEYKFRTLAETTASGILIFRKEMFIYANPAAEHITGYSCDELSKMTFWAMVHPDYQALIREAGSKRLGDEYVPYGTYEIKIITKDGKEKWVDATAGTTFLEGKPAGMVTMFDITERTQAENALHGERKKFQSLIERAPFGMVMMGKDGTTRYINPKFHELFGYDLEDIPDGKTWLRKAFPEADYRRLVIEAWLQNIESIMGAGEMQPVSYAVTCKNGTQKMINFISMGLEDGGYQTTCEDVTEVMRSEDALRDSEEKYRNIIEKSLVGVYIIQDGRFKFVNQKFCDIHQTTYEEVLKSGEASFKIHPDDRKLVIADMRKCFDGEQESVENEFRIVLDNGEVKTVKAIGSSSSYKGHPAIQGTLLDISKEKILEHQLLQSQKLETVGRLAGGIAHDFNNVLNVILGNAQLAKHLIPAEHRVFTYCTSIEEAVFRAADFVKQLLAFSRRQLMEMKVVNLNDALKGFKKMVGRVLGENIDIKVITGHDLSPVKADLTQIDQILLNLVINARDSMPQGGELVIETFNRSLYAEYCRFNTDASPGSYAVLSVTDTGVGMSQEMLSKIFEPFFSNKDMGAGLGLAVVYGIVTQHNGFINVYSEVGRGTTFKIYIPAVVEETEDEHEITPLEKKASGETILVVEDEEPLRNIAAEVLLTLGYKVITAANGEEAVDIFKERYKEIDCALVDVVMPKMGGREAYDAMKQIQPSIRVLFMTGYSLNGIHTNFILEQDIDAIQKPYSFDALAKKIREILDR